MLYGELAVWQDDPARIHRTQEALEACSAFKFRIPHEHQAPKMADVWPIENVWSIVKDRVLEKNPESKAQRVIIQVWKEVNRDKAMFRRLINSIPKRLQAVIEVEGDQISKPDYERGPREE